MESSIKEGETLQNRQSQLGTKSYYDNPQRARSERQETSKIDQCQPIRELDFRALTNQEKGASLREWSGGQRLDGLHLNIHTPTMS